MQRRHTSRATAYFVHFVHFMHISSLCIFLHIFICLKWHIYPYSYSSAYRIYRHIMHICAYFLKCIFGFAYLVLHILAYLHLLFLPNANQLNKHLNCGRCWTPLLPAVFFYLSQLQSSSFCRTSLRKMILSWARL